jgi:hypothetical protein
MDITPSEFHNEALDGPMKKILTTVFLFILALAFVYMLLPRKPGESDVTPSVDYAIPIPKVVPRSAPDADKT